MIIIHILLHTVHTVQTNDLLCYEQLREINYSGSRFCADYSVLVPSLTENSNVQPAT